MTRSRRGGLRISSKEKEYERELLQIKDMVKRGILSEAEHKYELDLLQRKYRP